MSDSYNTRIKLKRDTEANWLSQDPVLLDGEIAIVRLDDGETRKKIGDGTKKFSELPYDGGDFVQYAAQTLTDAQKKQARENVDALGSVSPTIKDGTLFMEMGGTDFQIQIQLNGNTSATGEDFAELDFLNIAPQPATDGVVIGGLANFGDAELVGVTDTAVSYAQLLDYTKPLMLTYNNNQVTGASDADIRRAIERGRQIKLAVANTPDIIASNAKNETGKCVLRFIHTDVGGDAVNITQYTVTAQASGLTVNVKSHEIADGTEVSY